MRSEVSERISKLLFARRAVERHTVKTRSGASGLQHSQICLTMHALGKANIKIKDRCLEKKEMLTTVDKN